MVKITIYTETYDDIYNKGELLCYKIPFEECITDDIVKIYITDFPCLGWQYADVDVICRYANELKIMRYTIHTDDILDIEGITPDVGHI